MTWNHWIRQIHRWLSIAFTVTVVANIVVMTQGQPPAWVTYSPLLPLALLFDGDATLLGQHQGTMSLRPSYWTQRDTYDFLSQL